MQKAPIPQNENERLAELKAMNILDTSPEERFDRITRIATQLFNVPISTITLIDSKREWFKSCQGLSEKEGDRAVSFCGHAVVEEKDVFIIPDASKDPRFADNPMVTGEPFVRLYAGVPLSGPNGYHVGVFCIKDKKIRTLTDAEIQSLRDLATWAELELNTHELSRALVAVKEREAKIQELMESLRTLQAKLNQG